jgi:membrane protein
MGEDVLITRRRGVAMGTGSQEPSVREDGSDSGNGGAVAWVRGRIETVERWVQATLVWGVWERMLETEFVDRSVALAGKAFVSFFPLVIVVAAFLPSHARASVFTSLTTRLGLSGKSLADSKAAFASADNVRKATGVLGLLMTFFFSSSFTTALQRVYLRAWRRPRDLRVGSYTRGLSWLAALLLYMLVNGAVLRALGSVGAIVLGIVLAMGMAVLWWWFTAWYLLLGHVRWRALLPTAVLTSVATIGYALSAHVWMPNVVSTNQAQFGFFGVALALVTWFSGASVCIIVGACAGPVFADDTGLVGHLCRGRGPVLVPGAPEGLPAPAETLRLRDAFRSLQDEVTDLGDSVDDDRAGDAARS